jgi:hypothetical protein
MRSELQCSTLRRSSEKPEECGFRDASFSAFRPIPVSVSSLVGIPLGRLHILNHFVGLLYHIFTQPQYPEVRYTTCDYPFARHVARKMRRRGW